MDEKEKAQNIALFRYSIISPVITESGVGQTKYFKKMEEKEYIVPSLGKKRYKWKTFKSWLRLYRLFGFDGLLPKKRIDYGISRKINIDLKETIKSFYDQYPYTSIATIFKRLVADGTVNSSDFCEETLRRYIKENSLKPKKEIIPRKKFEKPHINDLWMSDFMHSKRHYLINNKKQHLILCTIIDDHSRLITGARWDAKENTDTLETVFKDALLPYGMPKCFYCDNGSAFSSSHLQLACARLGIHLIHSKPYDSPSRGKIERFFRTVRSSFMPLVDYKHSYTLLEFNELFWDWIKNEYHSQIHRGIGCTPLDRYIDGTKETNIRRLSNDEIQKHFLKTYTRLVKNDATISIKSVLFETPAKYIGQKIEVRHQADAPSDLWIYENDKPVRKLNHVDPAFNSYILPSIQFAKKEDEK